MCFSAVKIKILNCKIQTDDFQIMVRNPKFEKKSKRLKAEIEVFNASNESARYSNQNLFVTVAGKKYRTYLDSPVSNSVDFAFVEIPSKSSVKRKVCFFMEDTAVFDLWLGMGFSYRKSE